MKKQNHQAKQETHVPSESGQAVSLVVMGVTVIDIHTGSKAVLDIVIKGERIVQIGPHGSLDLPADIQVMVATGQYAIPGLCDMHVHITAWPEFKDRISALFIANGVTSVRDMGGQLDDILAFRKQATQEGTVAPRLWIAGPIIDGSPRIMEEDPVHGIPDMSVAVDTPEEATRLVDALIKKGVDFIKAYEMLQPEVFTALLRRAQAHQRQAAGHLPIRMTIPQVLEVGQYDIQHLGGVCSGMKFECVTNPQRLLADRVAILDKHLALKTAEGSPLGKTAEGSPPESGLELAKKILNTVAVAPSEQNADRRATLIQRFVEQGIWHTPTLVNTVGFHTLGFNLDPDWLNAFRYLPKIRQANSQTAREKVKEHETWGQWNLETVGEMHKAGVKFLAGTDSPPTPFYAPGSALHFELKALVLSGLSPLAALQSATINAAEFFNLTNDLGSIEAGKYADIVLLEADPLTDINHSRRINAVISRGRFLDRHALDGMLADVVE